MISGRQKGRNFFVGTEALLRAKAGEVCVPMGFDTFVSLAEALPAKMAAASKRVICFM